jgi:hypothetical protein
MCNFFSFISDGQGNFKYFSKEDREFFRIDNPKEYEMDSHASIAAFHGVNEDHCNKYEYTTGEFMVDQINTHDDSAMAEKWVVEFVKGSKFHAICLEAVRQNCYVLEYVPTALLDREMCLEAVRQNGSALYYVPEALLDREMCLDAVWRNGCALWYVPEALLDREMCLDAVRRNGCALQYVPKALLDREMCLDAVRLDGCALVYVPMALRDREMCLEAVRQNGYALLFVPKDIRKEIEKLLDK